MNDVGNIFPIPNIGEIEAEAAAWVARFEDGGATRQDELEFEAWRNKSDIHSETYQRLAALWGGFDRAEELSDYAAASAREGAAHLTKASGSLLSKRHLSMAVAASLLLMIGAGIFYRMVDVGRMLHNQIYQTDLGEQKDIPLPDGSVVELNTGSRIEVDLRRTVRIVRLMRGEAFFQVAPDNKRPFSVYAGDGVVTAVGTAFSVKVDDKRRVNLLVAEGRVRIVSGAGAPDENKHDSTTSGFVAPKKPAKPSMEVTAGQSVVFEKKVERLDHVEAAALERKLMWRSGLLAFAGEPLSEVVEDVSRYSPVRIVIADDELRDVPVAGYFRLGEVDTMLEGLAALVDIEVTHLPSNTVVISHPSEG